MNISELKKVLPVLFKNSVTPFIWGQQGIGKSQSIKQAAKERGMGFVHLHLATQEVGDVVGLLMKKDDGTAYHTRPEWFPTEGKGILFLDELNRAHPDVIQAMFSLITEKTIHTHKLPDGWVIVAAGNYQTAAFNVTDTSDAAWMSRFCHIDLQPTVEEFVLFTEEQGNFSVANFIRTHKECLEVHHKERLNYDMITPDRRSWNDMIGRLEKEESIEDVRFELYSGIVGKTAAATFLTFKKQAQSRISGRQLLNDYDSVRKQVLDAFGRDDNHTEKDGGEIRFDLVNGAVEEILALFAERQFSDKEMENFKRFLLDAEIEMGLRIMKRLDEIKTNPQRNKILNDREFVDKFRKTKLANKFIEKRKEEKKSK